MSLISNSIRKYSSSIIKNGKVVNPLHNAITMIPGTSVTINTDVTKPLDTQFETPIGNYYYYYYYYYY
jgi:hypothetical protein